MDKFSWCLKKKEGISLIEPNKNLAEAYFKKAEDSLRSLSVNVIKEWKIVTAYYTIYFSLYSLLMKIGVKCEIHSCTIYFAKKFLTDYFSKEDFSLMDIALKSRIDSQYYVGRAVPDKQYEIILSKVPEFLVKCKEISIKINEKKILEIRGHIK